MPENHRVHIHFRDVDKSFDGQSMVVSGLNLEIYEGEFLTLLGPSGSGKTTCLMMLAGFEAPTSGSIEVFNDEIASIPPYQRNMGMVFQNYALFPHLTVEKNLAFPLEVRSIPAPERRAKIERALHLVRLEEYANRSPSQLSGGQQQRVAIARALVFEPDIVLMDEPLGALDRRLREDMQFEIRRIQREVGVTMVYVTHDQEEAMVISDRIAVFNEGKIQQLATPEVLYEEPEQPFVATFIGNNNLLRGSVAATSGDHCQIDVEGFTLSATVIGKLAVGDHVFVSIRPERMAINPPEDVYSNVLDADIMDAVFLGDHIRFQISTLGDQEITAKIPNIAGHGAVLKGDRVKLGLSQLDCRAYGN